MGSRGGVQTQPGWVVWESFLKEEVIPEASPKQRRVGDILDKHAHGSNTLSSNCE